MSAIQRLTWNIFPVSALLSEKLRQIWRQNTNAASQKEWVEFHQQMHFLYRSFLCEYGKKKSALFLLILPLPGGFVFVHQSACFMNVLQWSGFVSLPQKNYKNQVSPTELVCNQFGIALTSMYQSAYWVGWSTMAYQILAMSQYCLLLCWYLLSLFYYTMETFSMWEVRRRFFAIGGILHGLKCFNVMPGLRSYDSPNVNTTSGLLGDPSQRGWIWVRASL